MLRWGSPNDGVEAERLESVGYGESRPIDPRPGEVAWAVNRRVEVRILERRPTAP